jgi:protein-S-isoprenylcysteine O-methyltransferase Ste14
MESSGNEISADRSKIKSFSRIRLYAGYLYLLLILIFATPRLSPVIVGAPLIILGIFLRIVARGTIVKDIEVTTHGIYSVTRNPIYLGSALIGLGFALIGTNLWIFSCYFLILFPIYYYQILLEEDFLFSVHEPAFREYMMSTPRFLPDFRRMKDITAYMKFSRLEGTGEIPSSGLILLIEAAVLFIHRSWFTLA